MCCGLAFKAKGRRDRSRGEDDASVFATISPWMVHCSSSLLRSETWNHPALVKTAFSVASQHYPPHFPNVSLSPLRLTPMSPSVHHLTLTHIAVPDLESLWTASAIFNVILKKSQSATHTCTYMQCADTHVVCVLWERELGVCLCLHHLLPLQRVFAVSTGCRPLHQTLGNLWISSFSKSFWVSGCVTQWGQSALGATGLLCLCGISDAFCLP